MAVQEGAGRGERAWTADSTGLADAGQSSAAIRGSSVADPPGQRRSFMARFLRQPAALVGTAILTTLVVVALAADYIAPYDPFASTGDVLFPPSAAHLLGTDDLGHDLFTDVVYGTRVSLLIGVGSVLIATLIGIVVGSISGFVG